MPDVIELQSVKKEVELPLSDNESKKLGWTFSYEYVKTLSEKSSKYGGFGVGMEQVESVLMALFNFKEYGPEDVETT